MTEALCTWCMGGHFKYKNSKKEGLLERIVKNCPFSNFNMNIACYSIHIYPHSIQCLLIIIYSVAKIFDRFINILMCDIYSEVMFEVFLLPRNLLVTFSN